MNILNLSESILVFQFPLGLPFFFSTYILSNSVEIVNPQIIFSEVP